MGRFDLFGCVLFGVGLDHRRMIIPVRCFTCGKVRLYVFSDDGRVG